MAEWGRIYAPTDGVPSFDGTPVMLTGGRWLLEEPLVIPATASGQIIMCSGAQRNQAMPNSTVLQPLGAFPAILIDGAQGVQILGGVFIDLLNVQSGKGVELRGAQNCLLQTVFARSQGSGAGLYLTTTPDLSCIHNVFVNCGAQYMGDGVRLNSSDPGKATNSNTFTGLFAGHNVNGIRDLTGCHENVFISAELSRCGNGIVCRGRDTVLQGATIENCDTGVLIPAGAEKADISGTAEFGGTTTPLSNPDGRPCLLHSRGELVTVGWQPPPSKAVR